VAQIEKDLKALYDEGYRSIAIIFVHSYTFPQHEEIVGNIARWALVPFNKYIEMLIVLQGKLGSSISARVPSSCP